MKISQRAYLLLLVAIAAGCQPPPAPPAPPPAQVTVAQAAEREVSEWDEYTGRIEAPEYVELRPRVGGYLTEVTFMEGAMVKKGETLYVIDPRPYQADLDRAEAEVARAEAALKLAQAEFARAEKLRKDSVLSPDEFDKVAAQRMQAEAMLRSGRAAADSARLNLEFTRVTAPISGRVSRTQVTVGNLVQPGTTLLTTLVSLDPVYAWVDVDERSVLKYNRLAREGKRESARDTTIPMFLGLGDETGFPHEGFVDFVDNRLDPRTGSIRARGVFRNADRRFTPGMFARLRVAGSGKYSAITVPDRALGSDQAAKFVFVVDAEKKVQFRPVKAGPLIDGARVIQEGLKPGEWVISEGLMKARPGAVVEPVDAGGKPITAAAR
jgi:RND family efflux transporter MFP subunit